ncbi:minor capsid protein [Auritidibacter sp. NML100628]|uniref:phage tail terminator protein n=1 Tax=Auritidibacter sp. NML100628 TaxID=2170742 RepID=UPI000D738DDE|nr:minor capsid protein [Auritidibacter sp. NML100628]PXA77932.1 hypothetical protein DCC24_03290 [Auritidibacter sp. NML100628]
MNTGPIRDSITLETTAGFIALMVEAGVGTWNEDGLYQPDDWGIVVGRLPHTPAKLIGVTPYVARVDAQPRVDERAIQVRYRSASPDPRPLIILVDRLHDHIHGRSNINLGGHHVPLIWRHSLADLGADQNNQYEITDNYYFYLDK